MRCPICNKKVSAITRVIEIHDVFFVDKDERISIREGAADFVSSIVFFHQNDSHLCKFTDDEDREEVEKWSEALENLREGDKVTFLEQLLEEQ